MLKQRISLDCDKYILNLMHQLLMETDEDTPKFNKEQQILILFTQVFNSLGAIVVTHEGEIQLMSQEAEKLLSQYSLPHTPQSLPEPLQHWFKHQISLLKSKGKVLSPCLPLHIERAEKQLVIRFISNLIAEQYLLLLEEQELQVFSVSSLELLGLTKREAEVLFWVAKDKSNEAIAGLLNCKKGTVRKHLEHIHAKLDVQTRTAAVMVAIERLGLLKRSFVAISS